jgi:hypothetical protein
MSAAVYVAHAVLITTGSLVALAKPCSKRPSILIGIFFAVHGKTPQNAA